LSVQDGFVQVLDLAVAELEELLGLGSREVIALPEPPHVRVEVRLHFLEELPSEVFAVPVG